MRPLTFIVCLVCLAGTTIVVYDHQTRPRPAPFREEPAEVDPIGPKPIGPKTTDPKTTDPKTTDPEHRVQTPRKKRPGRPDSNRLQSIRSTITAWELVGKDGEYLRRFPEHSRAKPLLAEWDLKRALLEKIENQRDPLPDTIEAISLENGQHLFARSKKRTDRGFEYVLLNGITVTFPEHKIDEARTLDRGRYLDETQKAFEIALAELRDEPRDILRAIARTLDRGDALEAEKLFERWLTAGGAVVLARGTDESQGARLRQAAEELGFEPPESVAMDDPDVEDTGDGTPSAAGKTGRKRPRFRAEAPRDPKDLDKKLKRMAKKVRGKLSPDHRDRLLTELQVWDRWLESDGKNQMGNTAKLDELRQTIQFLTMDVLGDGPL